MHDGPGATPVRNFRFHFPFLRISMGVRGPKSPHPASGVVCAIFFIVAPIVRHDRPQHRRVDWRVKARSCRLAGAHSEEGSGLRDAPEF